MEKPPDNTEQLPCDTPDFYVELTTLEETIPSDVISEKGRTLAAQLLEEVHRRHYDKPYHDATHAMNVIRRTWQLWRLGQSIIPERFGKNGYELGLLCAAAHDVVHDQAAPPEHNEQQSAQYLAVAMQNAGYTPREIKRCTEVILTTVVTVDTTGTVSQVNIRSGDRDPLKLTVALGDIDGVLMEGPRTMTGDMIDLYLETHHVSIDSFLKQPSQAASFMYAQSKFVRDRLAAFDDDLRYYFPSVDEYIRIRGAFREEFSTTAQQALRAANIIQSLQTAQLPDAVMRATRTAARTTAQTNREQLSSFKQTLAQLLLRATTHRNK